MDKNNYCLEVFVNNRPVREYSKDGRIFIEGRKNTEYTLKFRNYTSDRVMAIFSVDGIEVIKGQLASQSDTGYVVNAYDSIEIKGYRIDDNNVAAFKFTDTERSYSNEVGAKVKNPVTGQYEYRQTIEYNGVIGVRVYQEKTKPAPIVIKEKEYVPYPYPWYPYYPPRKPWWDYPLYCTSANLGEVTWTSNSRTTSNIEGGNLISYSCSNIYDDISDIEKEWYKKQKIKNDQPITQNTPDFDIGTTWGTKQEDRVIKVEFEKSNIYVDLEIYYTTRQKLQDYGIDFDKTKRRAEFPSAFPSDSDYCKSPDWYKGK